MKFFRTLFAVIGVAMLGVVGTLAQDEDTVIEAIQSVTDQSANFQVLVSKITIRNIVQTGPEIAGGLVNLTSAVQGFLPLLSDGDNVKATRAVAAFPDDTAQEVVDVLTTFVVVHQLLLNTIIGKQSLASRFFLTRPIAAALRGLESVVDAFAFALIDLIPTQQNAASFQIDKLSTTFTEAIAAYH